MSDALLTEMSRVFAGKREVVWEDPPPRVAGKHARGPREGVGTFVIVLALLRLAPGRWVRIGPFEYASKFAVQMKRAKAEGFEAVSRGPACGPNFLYLRWPEPARVCRPKPVSFAAMLGIAPPFVPLTADEAAALDASVAADPDVAGEPVYRRVTPEPERECEYGPDGCCMIDHDCGATRLLGGQDTTHTEAERPAAISRDTIPWGASGVVTPTEGTSAGA